MLVDESVARLVGEVQDEPGIGVAHCRLLLPDGRVQHTAYRFPSLRLALLEDLGLYKLCQSDGRRDAARAATGTTTRSVTSTGWPGPSCCCRGRCSSARAGSTSACSCTARTWSGASRIRDAGWRIRYYPHARDRPLRPRERGHRWWGDERIALCLRASATSYAGRHGRLARRR